MNILRGLISMGIATGCLLNWIEIGMFNISGLDWPPATVLLFVSLLSSCYAFYNRFNGSNQNTWIYLVCGLFGIGICIYGYMFAREKMSYLDLFLGIDLTDLWTNAFGSGFYLTGICSVLLFFTGFDKAYNKQQLAQQTFEPQYNSIKQQDNQ